MDGALLVSDVAKIILDNVQSHIYVGHMSDVTACNTQSLP